MKRNLSFIVGITGFAVIMFAAGSSDIGRLTFTEIVTMAAVGLVLFLGGMGAAYYFEKKEEKEQ